MDVGEGGGGGGRQSKFLISPMQLFSNFVHKDLLQSLANPGPHPDFQTGVR